MQGIHLQVVPLEIADTLIILGSPGQGDRPDPLADPHRSRWVAPLLRTDFLMG
jgi:hypothetical protein